MDYSLPRKDEVIIQRLSYPGLFPIADLNGALDNGEISGSTANTIKTQCSFDYQGDDIHDGDTIGISVLLDNGHEQEVDRIGTFRIFSSDAEGRRRSFNGYSLTKIADSARFFEPYSVPAGDDPFDHIIGILDSVGLRVAYRPDGSHSVRSAKSYLPEKYTKLDIVNDLLDCAGYLAADTNEYGYVIFRKSVPTPDFSSVVFEEGEASIVEDDPKIERDWEDVANVVIVTCETADDEVLRGIAVNDSLIDTMSTVFRGEIVRTESMQDADSQEIVDAKAASLLAEERSKLEAVNIVHAYRPLGLFDPMHVRVGGVDSVYTVQSFKLALDVGLKMNTRGRRFVL